MNNILQQLLSVVSKERLAEAYEASEKSFAITKRRIALGMNTNQYAEYMGVSPKTIEVWENGDYNFTQKEWAYVNSK